MLNMIELSRQVSKVLFLSTIVFFSLGVWAQPLSAILPKNTFVSGTNQLQFSWNKLEGSNGYTVHLAQDTQFLTSFFQSPVITNPTWFSTPLSSGIWFWKVVSNNGSQTFESAVYSFRVFQPNLISGNTLWLASDSLVNTLSGAVTQWNDLSGSNNHFSQTTASSQPLLIPTLSSLNNKPVLRFDGTSDFLSAGNVLNIGTNSVTTFMVAKGTGSYYSKFGAAAVPYNIFACYNIGTAQGHEFAGTGYQAFNGTNSTNYHVISFLANRSTNLAKLYRNFNTINTGTITGVASNYNVTNTNPFLIGRYAMTGTPYYLNGDVAEVILFNSALNDSLRILVQSYLTSKYSPAIDLGKDTTVANFCPYTLSAPNGFSSILWSTGATTSSITVNSAGMYWVSGVNLLGVSSRDTIMIYYPQIPLPENTGICAGGNAVWNANMNLGSTYSWNNGQTSSSLTITSPGDYFVQVTDALGCFKYSDTITFTIDNYTNTAFLGADTSLCAGNFLGLQVGASETTDYLWGDGTSNSSLLVNTTGTYSVQTTNINGCIAQDTINVNIIGVAPLAQFTTGNQCDQTAVVCADQSVPVGASPIDGWQWDFGDGQGFSSSQNPNYTYTSPGTYTIQLYVSQGGCGAYHYDTIQVFENPAVDFSYTGHCQGATIQFSNLSVAGDSPIQSYAWDFAMPWTGVYNTSTIPVPNRIFDTPGEYLVSFQVTDGNGCKDSIVQPVIIDPTPQTAMEVINSCQLADANIANLTPVEPGLMYNWNFGDNSFSILPNPVKNYDLYGTYIVTLNVTNTFGCVGSEAQDIVIYPKPNAIMDLGPACVGSYGSLDDISTVISGSMDSSIWIINATDTLYGANAFYPWSSLGQQQVQLIAFSAEGCSANANQFFDITETLSASFSPASNIVAAGDPTAFTNTSQGNGIYLWNFGDNTFSSQVDPSHTFSDSYIDSPLTISLIVMNISGCIDTAFQSIQVLEPALDLELSQLFVDEVDGWNIIGVKMKNTGTADITKATLVLRSQKGFLFNEVWEGVLNPLEDSIYVFSAEPIAGFSSQDQQDAFYCIDGVGYSISGEQEQDLSNNSVCLNIEGERVILQPIYPNPIDDVMHLSLLVSVSSEVSIELMDSRGRVVKSILSNITLEPGVFSYDVSLAQINAGAYFLRMTTGDGEVVEKVTVK
jgi:PKD repeat protein